MTISERKELMDTLATIYITEKRNSQVYEREESRGYYIALGKLQGACMALNLDFHETNKGLAIFTRSRRKIIVNIKKGDETT